MPAKKATPHKAKKPVKKKTAKPVKKAVKKGPVNSPAAEGISLQQARFCQEYVIDLNGTKAAIRAGYSSKGADVQAARLLGNVRVQEKIQQLLKDRSDRTQVTADRVLAELAKIAFSNTTDYIKIQELWKNKGRSKISFRSAVAELTELIPPDKRGAIAEIKQQQFGIGIKTFDKVKALELLGKHLGMFKEIHDLNFNNAPVASTTVIIENPHVNNSKD